MIAVTEREISGNFLYSIKISSTLEMKIETKKSVLLLKKPYFM